MRPDRGKIPRRHVPKKSLGQNFLVSEAARNRILTICDIHSGDEVLEIGPGKGVLTEQLLEQARHLTVVEKDQDLVKLLREKFADHASLTIVSGDILNYQIPEQGDPIKVVGNIPYNISTPIVEHMIAQRERIKVFFMTVQLEFGRRLAARPGNKDYGSLSCFAQYFSDVRVHFQIKNTAFSPVPKVNSCFVEMRFLDQPRYPVDDPNGLLRFIQMTFTKRRKMIANALPVEVSREEIVERLETLRVDPKVRPEQISLKTFVDIYKQFRMP